MTTTDVEHRRVLLLEAMPCRDVDYVRLNGYSSVLGARSALRTAQRLKLCIRDGAIWRRTPAGDKYILDFRKPTSGAAP